jgi:hypothetical protein
MIPAELIEACDRNSFVWRRQSPDDIDKAFDELSLLRSGELYEFCKQFCLQFHSDTLPFELAEIVDEYGVSDNIYYARDELGISPEMVPISPWGAEAIAVVDTTNDSVLILTANDSGDGWNQDILSASFYAFMQEHLG